jgi:hypothetical protein
MGYYLPETFNEYFVAISENVKREIKHNLINDVNNSIDNNSIDNNCIDNNSIYNNSIDNHTHFVIQAFNKCYPEIWKVNTRKRKILNRL